MKAGWHLLGHIPEFHPRLDLTSFIIASNMHSLLFHFKVFPLFILSTFLKPPFVVVTWPIGSTRGQCPLYIQIPSSPRQFTFQHPLGFNEMPPSHKPCISCLLMGLEFSALIIDFWKTVHDKATTTGSTSCLYHRFFATDSCISKVLFPHNYQ